MRQTQLGKTGIQVSRVALGCWPIAGMTSLDVNERDSLATIHAAVDAGVNFLDTAYCYGTAGESELLIAKSLRDRQDELVIASKVGIQLTDNGSRILDGSPSTLKSHCDISLARLETNCLDLLYLHAPDPSVPIRESAGALHELLRQGKTRSVGASNCSLQQLKEFQQECPLSAYQPPYNMLMREIEDEILPWCEQEEITVAIYWPLMKGLLAGKLSRDHQFEEGDGRPKYPMFQGTEWEKNQDLVDGLREIARGHGKTVAQLAVSWTLAQPGVNVALCGAKRPDQITETAVAMDWTLDDGLLEAVDRLLARRGRPVTRAAI